MFYSNFNYPHTPTQSIQYYSSPTQSYVSNPINIYSPQPPRNLIYTANQQPLYINPTPNYVNYQASFVSNIQTPLNSYQPKRNVKKNLDTVYNECIKKLANERKNIVSPSKKRFCKVRDDENNYFEGEMIGNEKNGYGVLKNEDMQEIYNGDWKKNKFDGIGALNNVNQEKFEGSYNYKDFNELANRWNKYEGDFVANKKNGLGMLYLTNGESFHGYFKDNQIDGEGTFIRNNGEIIIGKWKSNKLILIY